MHSFCGTLHYGHEHQRDTWTKVNDGISNYYTRSGVFDIDEAGNLVSAGNREVTLWMWEYLDRVVICNR